MTHRVITLSTGKARALVNARWRTPRYHGRAAAAVARDAWDALKIYSIYRTCRTRGGLLEVQVAFAIRDAYIGKLLGSRKPNTLKRIVFFSKNVEIYECTSWETIFQIIQSLFFFSFLCRNIDNLYANHEFFLEVQEKIKKTPLFKNLSVRCQYWHRTERFCLIIVFWFLI